MPDSSPKGNLESDWTPEDQEFFDDVTRRPEMYMPYIRAFAREILRLRAELASKRHVSRWNIEEGNDSLRVCKGDHERSAGCDFEEYVPRSPSGIVHDLWIRKTDPAKLVEP